MPSNKVKSFDQALLALDEASRESSDEIRRAMPLNYKTLKGALQSMSNFQGAARDLKEKSIQTLALVKDKAVESSKDAAKHIDRQAHKRPWIFVAIAAAFSAFFGFFLGRKTKN